MTADLFISLHFLSFFGWVWIPPGGNIWVYHAAGGLILEAAMARFPRKFLGGHESLMLEGLSQKQAST